MFYNLILLEKLKKFSQFYFSEFVSFWIVWNIFFSLHDVLTKVYNKYYTEIDTINTIKPKGVKNQPEWGIEPGNTAHHAAALITEPLRQIFILQFFTNKSSCKNSSAFYKAALDDGTTMNRFYYCIDLQYILTICSSTTPVSKILTYILICRYTLLIYYKRNA